MTVQWEPTLSFLFLCFSGKLEVRLVLGADVWISQQMYKDGSRCELNCNRWITRMRYVRYRANRYTPKSERKCAADDFELATDCLTVQQTVGACSRWSDYAPDGFWKKAEDLDLQQMTLNVQKLIGVCSRWPNLAADVLEAKQTSLLRYQEQGVQQTYWVCSSWDDRVADGLTMY